MFVVLNRNGFYRKNKVKRLWSLCTDDYL